MPSITQGSAKSPEDVHSDYGGFLMIRTEWAMTFQGTS
jgi:hypothetical protein